MPLLKGWSHTDVAGLSLTPLSAEPGLARSASVVVPSAKDKKPEMNMSVT